MSEPHSAHSHRPAREPHQDKRSFLQKLAEFIHPGPDSKDELIETLAEAENNHIIGAQSRAMLEGVIRMSDMTASDVMVPATRLDALDINAEFEKMAIMKPKGKLNNKTNPEINQKGTNNV